MTLHHSLEPFPDPGLALEEEKRRRLSQIPAVQWLLCIVKDHHLPIAPLDRDEPGMKGFGDHNVPLIGQTSFWFKARRFARK